MFGRKKKPMIKIIDDITTTSIPKQGQMLSYKVANVQDIGRRSSQEDSFSVLGALDAHEMSEQGVFAIVADGMGGLENGKAISEAVTALFCKEYRNLIRDETISKQLAKNVGVINEAMYAQFEGNSGSTVVMVTAYRSMLYWVSIGDSAIYLRRNGGLYRLNQYHTLRNDLYEELIGDCRIDSNRAEANANPEGHCLTQFLGAEDITKIDYNKKPFPLQAKDVICLCSDGVSGVLSSQELCEILALEPPAACRKILQSIMDKGKPNQDNATAIVLSCCE